MLLDFLLFLSGLWALSAPPPLRAWRLARVAYPPLVMLQILMLYCMILAGQSKREFYEGTLLPKNFAGE